MAPATSSWSCLIAVLVVVVRFKSYLIHPPYLFMLPNLLSILPQFTSFPMNSFPYPGISQDFHSHDYNHLINQYFSLGSGYEPKLQPLNLCLHCSLISMPTNEAKALALCHCHHHCHSLPATTNG